MDSRIGMAELLDRLPRVVWIVIVNEHDLESSPHFLKDINETLMKLREGFSASVYGDDNRKLHLAFNAFHTSI